MHKRSWHPFYMSEGSYYLILYTRLSVRLQFLVCATPPTGPSELDLFEICHNGTQSFPHTVNSTLSQFDTSWSFRPIFWSIRPTNSFLQQMVVLTPFIFLIPNIEQKKIVFVCTVCCNYFNIIIFFLLQYIVKSTSSPMLLFTFFVLLLQIHYHLDTYSGGIVFADIGN